MSVKTPNIPSLPSSVHPDVRRMATALKAFFEEVRKSGGLQTGTAATAAAMAGLSDAEVVAIIGETLPGLTDQSVPPQPSGFTATGGFDKIMLQWDAPGYANHAHTELYRAEADNFGQAVRVSTWPGLVATDSPPDSSLSKTYYYWVRFVSQADVPGPLNATAGTPASTADDPAYVKEILAGEISETELYQALNARIDLIDTPGTGLVDRVEVVEGDNASQASQITALTARVDAGFTPNYAWEFNNSLESWQPDANVQATLNTTFVRLTALDTDPRFRSPAGLSFAGALNTIIRMRIRRAVGSSWDGTLYYSVSGGHGESASYYKTIPGVTADGEWHVIEMDMSVLTAGGTDWVDNTITSLRFDWGNDAGDVIDVDWIAIGTQSSTGHVAAVQTEATARADADGLAYAEYTIKLDANGKIAGIGVAVDGGASGPISSLVTIQADVFSIAHPTDPGEPDKVPFIVSGGKVYMDVAMIKDATITNAKIADLAVDNAKIADLSVSKLLAGIITATGIYLGANSRVHLDGANQRIVVNDGTRDRVWLGNLGGSSWGFKVWDAAGAVIFDAGGVTAGMVGGLGAFATLDQISAANISTYIAAAAIGTAYIGNLAVTSAKIGSAAVETLKIAGNAVTLPVSAYTDGSVGIGTGTLLQQINITVPAEASGQPVIVWYSVVLTLEPDTEGNSGSIAAWLEDSTGQLVQGDKGVFSKTLTQGVHTFSVKASYTSSGGMGDSGAARYRGMAAMLAKR